MYFGTHHNKGGRIVSPSSLYSMQDKQGVRTTCQLMASSQAVHLRLQYFGSTHLPPIHRFQTQLLQKEDCIS